MPEPDVVRYAGPFERWFIVRHYLKMYACVAISARYGERSGISLDANTLFPALDKVIRRHAALCVTLSGEASGKPAWVRLEKVDLTRVVNFSDDTQANIRTVFESEIAHRFRTQSEPADPLWRLRISRDGIVTFAWHHAIGDGRSGLAFHHSLLEALNEVDTEGPPRDPCTSAIVPPNLSLVEPVENIISTAVSPLTLCRQVLQLLMPDSWKASYHAWTGHPVPDHDSLLATVRLVDYNRDATETLLRLCRANDSTITGFLMALSARVISRLIAADQSLNGRYKSIVALVPVSLRGLTKTPEDVFCSEVSSINRLIPLDPPTPPDGGLLSDSFHWELAAELTRDLRRHAPQSTQQLGLLKFLPDYEAYLKGFYSKKRNATIEISNLGTYPWRSCDSDHRVASDGEAGKWNIDEMYFVQSQAAFMAAIHMNVVGTPGGGLGLTVSWSQGAIEEDFGESFYSGLKDCLDDMAQVAKDTDLE